MSVLLFSAASALPARVMVLLKENNGYWWDNQNMQSASTGMTQSFLKNGLVVIDSSQLNEIKNRNMILSALDGDIKSAITLATSFNADAVIVGNAIASHSVGINLGPFAVQGYSGTVNVRATIASTGQVISAVTGKSNQAGLSGSEGERSALTAVGEDAANKLVNQLQGLSSQKSNISLTHITIKNLQGFTDALTIVKELQAQKGITSVERRSFSSGILELDLTADFSADDIAALLESLTLTKLSVTEVGNNSIAAVVK